MSAASPQLQPRVLLLGVGSVILPIFVVTALVKFFVTDSGPRSPWLYLIVPMVLVLTLAGAHGARRMQRQWLPSAQPAYDRVVSWTVLLCVVALVIYSVAFMEIGLGGLGYAAMLIVVVTRLRDLRQR